MTWPKVVGGLAALAVIAAAGAALGIAERPSNATTATNAPPTASSTTAPPATTTTPPTTATRNTPSPTAPVPTSTVAPGASTTVAQPGDDAPGTTVASPGATSLPTFTPANPADPNVAALTAKLAPIAAADPGCLEVTSGAQLLFQSQDTTLLAPGSAQKLLVAAAALDVLGPNYTFTTQVMAPAEPVNGTVSDLWLVGGGDPVLEEPAFNVWWAGQPRYAGDPFTNIDDLASAVRTAGVTAVTGGVHGDDSRYDEVRLNPVWPSDTLSDGDIAPMSALSLDMGFANWTSSPAVVPADPPSFVAGSFAQILTAAGVTAPDNPPGDDSTPPNGSVVIASIQSPPLSAIIGAMLRPSDNQIAELLLKELGYHATGLGTTAAGLALVQSTDTALGIPWDGTIMADASGLSHTDRTTCATLLSVLYLADQPDFSAIPADLAIAGENGTLADRFTTAPIQGHMRAKTGSIDDAAAMVGEIDIGPPVRFAMIFNQPASDSELLDHEDDAIAAISPYP
jgi:serine-type D-Ala-D-Ala carboxypeptidase/endopeptidase (penicillin-binding protein 4)